jgi:UDP-N-acetylmuramate dehydrogenase
MPPSVSHITNARLSESLKRKETLAPYTSWRIGGEAEFYAAPKSELEILRLVDYARAENLPLTVLGGGSNVLLSDQGIPGLVMHITHRFSGFSISPEGRVIARAGTRLGALIRGAIRMNLTGIEQLWGIPGTVGGSVVMNAGACNTETFDALVSVTSLTPQGQRVIRTRSEIAHGYRWSDYKYNGEIVIEAEFQLRPAEAELIADNFRLADERRRPQHNIRLPNSGSIFRNPENNFAGRLIEQLGAKGRICGKVQVSPEHANFIVNLGGASAQDACCLIEALQREVWESYQVQLEPEVIFLGEF